MTDSKNSDSSPTPDRAKEILGDFLDEEILRAHDSLRRSRTFGIILTAIVAAYMGFLARGLGEYLEPEEAARMTTIFVADQVQSQSDKLAEKIQRDIPAMIARLPDHFLEELPKYRQRLEDSVIDNSEQHMRTTIANLDLDLGEFLQAHQADVKALLNSTDKMDVPEAFNEAFFEHLMELITTTPTKGESFSQRLKRSLDMPKIAEERIDLLALNKNLSRAEKKTRYALAVLAQSIQEQLHEIQMKSKVNE